MKKTPLLLTYSIVFGLLISACGGSKEAVSPNTAQTDIISQNLALTKSMKGIWNTESVKDNDVLVYARNKEKNAIDYGKFQIDLKNDSKFSMIDKEGNKIEGEWYIGKGDNGNMLNLEYEKNDFKSCAVESTSQVCTVTSILVTISFDLAKAPSNNEVALQNKSINFLMKTSKVQ
jgi:hypothetical protein